MLISMLAPVTTIWPAFRPENPDIAAVLLRVNALPVPAEAIVSVPVPVSVPLSVISATVPLPTVGLLPSGKLQSLLTVLSPPVLIKLTRLNNLLPHDNVTLPVPVITTVPPLAIKVEAELSETVLPSVVVVDEAVKLEPAFATNTPPTFIVPLVPTKELPELRVTLVEKLTPAVGSVIVPPVCA